MINKDLCFMIGKCRTCNERTREELKQISMEEKLNNLFGYLPRWNQGNKKGRQRKTKENLVFRRYRRNSKAIIGKEKD